ncbi:IMPACT family member in pol 5'region [Chlorella vulgaris]
MHVIGTGSLAKQPCAACLHGILIALHDSVSPVGHHSDSAFVPRALAQATAKGVSRPWQSIAMTRGAFGPMPRKYAAAAAPPPGRQDGMACIFLLNYASHTCIVVSIMSTMPTAAATAAFRLSRAPFSPLGFSRHMAPSDADFSPYGPCCAVMRAASARWMAARAAGVQESAATTSAFVTLAAPHSSVTEVKKSKFCAHAWPCSSSEEAMHLIGGQSDASASHNCWAYKVGQEYRSSDDGEPGGTAGRPILYYGGIKLGAGGLVRAYGGAARDCLRSAPTQHKLPRVELRMQVPFELLGRVYPLLEQHVAQKLAETYKDGDGSDGVELVVSVEVDRADALIAALADVTSGRRQSVVEQTAATFLNVRCACHGGGMADRVKDVTDDFIVEDTAPSRGPRKQQDAPMLESDPHRLAQRQKQIDLGKNTLGYQQGRNKKQDPMTPDVYQMCSKRAFEGQVKKWRRQLHTWDPPEEGDVEPAAGPASNPPAPAGEPSDDFEHITHADAGKAASGARVSKNGQPLLLGAGGQPRKAHSAMRKRSYEETAAAAGNNENLQPQRNLKQDERAAPDAKLQRRRVESRAGPVRGAVVSAPNWTDQRFQDPELDYGASDDEDVGFDWQHVPRQLPGQYKSVYNNLVAQGWDEEEVQI